MNSLHSNVRPARIAVTGGIGSGKSTAAAMFAELGAATMDTDAVVHELLGNDDIRGDVARQLEIGSLEAGEAGRRQLADIVFSDREKLQQLEEALFPLVRDVVNRWMEKAEAANVAALVVEVPMLFEADMESLFDCVVMITAPAEVRRQRTAADREGDDFERRAERQLDEGARRLLCDFVYDNTGSREDMDRFVAGIYDEMTVSGS